MESVAELSEFAEEIQRKVMERVTGPPEKAAGSSLLRSINQSIEYSKEKSADDCLEAEGETRSIKHMIYEMNDFYLDMVDKLRDLKHADVEEDEEEDDCSALSDVVEAIERQRNDPDIKKQIETILKFDVELERNYEILKSEQEDRQNLQDEYCQILENDDMSDKDTQFLELCKMNSNKKISKGLAPSGSGDATTKKKNQSDSDKFIKRNIELARNTPMAGFSMTDEDKLKLETLLKDIDSMQFEAGDDSTERTETEDTEPDSTAYDFNEEETLRLEELEEKLEEFMEASSKEQSNFEDIERAVKEQKYWKNEKRLAHIEQELRNIQMEKEEAASVKTDTQDEDSQDEIIDEKKIVESYVDSLCCSNDDDDDL